MAQNFINYFETESLYNSAKSGLSQPNVSLVKESGNLHYTKHAYGLAASELGDIILEDSTKLYSIRPDVYNLTDFPSETYTPIGINVYPASESPDGKGRVISWGTPKADALGSFYYSYPQTVYFGPGTNISYIEDGITKNNNNDFNTMNGKGITEYVINNLVTTDFSGSSVTNDRNTYTLFCCAARVQTNVTRAGDWYIPSYKELTVYKNNYDLIQNTVNVIYSVHGSGTKTYAWSIGTLIEYNQDSSKIWTASSSWAGSNVTFGIQTRFMLQIGVEEV